jgi:Bacterial Ig domain
MSLLLSVPVATGQVISAGAAAGQQPPAEELPPVRELRSIPTAEYGAARPTGLAVREDGSLLVAYDTGRQARLLQLSPAEDPLATAELPSLTDPETLAVDPASDRLVALDGADVITVAGGDVRAPHPPTARIDADLPVGDPSGATFDPTTGTWFVLDGRSAAIVKVPMAAGTPGAPSTIEVPALRGHDLRGLALNPRDGLLYVASPGDGRLFALDQAGVVHATYSLLSLELVDLRAMDFAPSGDPTDDPTAVHLYLADAGDATAQGRVVEATLDSGAAVAATADTATLVQTLDVSRLRPPSPDPAGITYMPAADRLLFTDSEVEEMTIFQGVNLYQITRGGQLTNTGVTTAYSNEPTGAGFNPGNGTLFISDDNANRVFAVRPGPDGRYGTPDDPRSAVDTTAFGSQDAEGTEFDPETGHLLVIDGLAREVYDVDPVNGVFGDGNDAVTHFDVEQYGALDPEGIGVDTSRDSVVVADRAGRRVIELTRAGALIRVIDLRSFSRNPAGITVAPGSGGGSSYWIVDRGVDNGPDPNENDGKVYEVPAPSGDNPPSVSLTEPADGATVSGAVALGATAADDQGVSQVQFLVDGTGIGTDTNGTDGWSTTWNSAGVADGTHTLTAVATDTGGNTGPSAGVAVSVANSGAATSQEIAIAASLDDVEERANGRIWVATTDLDLVVDGSAPQTVGLRFTGVSAPRGARIVNAYVQFQTDEVSTGPANLVVRGQASDNAPAFTTTKFDLTLRPTTSASTTWVPAPWPTIGARGGDQRTPNLAPVLQQVVDRPGWSAGGALVLVVSGSGARVAEAFDGTFAPVLHIDFVGA